MILAGLFIIHIILLLNLQFTAWPEIFSFPYLLNNGFNLYKDMVHPYTPLLTVTLSYLYKIFGYNVLVVKIFTYFFILINDLLIFAITIKLTKKYIYGITSVVFYIFTQSFLEGNQLWFDFAITTPILLGTYFLINKKIFWSGLMFAVAFLIKQNSALFFIFALFLMFLNKTKIKEIQKFILGGLILIIPFFLILIKSNSLFEFFNWVLTYPSKYWTSFPNYVQLIPSNRQSLILVILFLPSIYLIFKNKIKSNILLLGSLVISVILIYPRFSFFHFQTGIAFLAILFGITASFFGHKKYIYLYLLLLLLVTKKDWGNDVRFIDDNKLIINKAEKIYLLGPHSLNYVKSSTLPPKPWIDNYGWYFEMLDMQEKMISGWKIDPPIYIYRSKPQNGNWYDLGTYQPSKVVKYIEENYKKIDEQNDIEIWKLQ